jgi:glutamate racemase
VNHSSGPIGVFDSGFGGLTILREFASRLPEHDFIYIGDNGRAPYGNRSFETIYQYTLQAVEYLFREGCPLVILACNTASAKALRTIQQRDLPRIAPARRVLGVIRPTVEMIGTISNTGHIGILATQGTVSSGSYPIEIAKFFPDLIVAQQACPMLVPLVENEEIENAGCDYFVRKYCDALMAQDPSIDVALLGCTHYPLLVNAFRRHLPASVTLLEQDKIVAASLIDYLNRHPEMMERCSRNAETRFMTTDAPELFDARGAIFLGRAFQSSRITLC